MLAWVELWYLVNSNIMNNEALINRIKRSMQMKRAAGIADKHKEELNIHLSSCLSFH